MSPHCHRACKRTVIDCCFLSLVNMGRARAAHAVKRPPSRLPSLSPLRPPSRVPLLHPQGLFLYVIANTDLTVSDYTV